MGEFWIFMAFLAWGKIIKNAEIAIFYNLSVIFTVLNAVYFLTDRL